MNLSTRFNKLQKDDPNKIMFSDYCRIQRKTVKADYTIISFSSVNTKRGGFRFTRAFSDFTGNVIYVNAPNDWYIGGIPSLGTSYQESAEMLKELVKIVSGGDSKIITVGGSMGGYGALLYGALMNAKYSICSGVELILRIYNGRSSRINNTISSIKLDKILSQSTCIHHIFAGALDPVDMISFSYFEKHEKLVWYIIEDQPHEVIGYIHEKYNLMNLVNQLIESDYMSINEIEYESKDRSFYLQWYVGSILNKVMSIMLKENLQEDEIVYILSTLNRMNRYDLIIKFSAKIKIYNSLVLFHIGKAYFNIKNYNKAKSFLLDAYEEENKEDWKNIAIKKMISTIKNEEL